MPRRCVGRVVAAEDVAGEAGTLRPIPIAARCVLSRQRVINPRTTRFGNNKGAMGRALLTKF